MRLRAGGAVALDGRGQVRADIFMTKGDPDGCMMNEDLSSGHRTPRTHPGRRLAEPLVTGQYIPWETETPVYMSTVDKVPGLQATVRADPRFNHSFARYWRQPQAAPDEDLIAR